jgi:hypothetical protein
VRYILVFGNGACHFNADAVLYVLQVGAVGVHKVCVTASELVFEREFGISFKKTGVVYVIHNVDDRQLTINAV